MAKITFTDTQNGKFNIKMFVVEKVALPLLYIVPLVMNGLFMWDAHKKQTGLIEASYVLGGVYIDSNTCVAGKNLFVAK